MSGINGPDGRRESGRKRSAGDIGGTCNVNSNSKPFVQEPAAEESRIKQSRAGGVELGSIDISVPVIGRIEGTGGGGEIGGCSVPSKVSIARGINRDASTCFSSHASAEES